MITIMYPKKKRIYCFTYEERLSTNHLGQSRTWHRLKTSHSFKDGMVGYECEKCRKRVCSDHWEEHNEHHVMEKLAR
jgi:hypothetical protein